MRGFRSSRPVRLFIAHAQIVSCFGMLWIWILVKTIIFKINIFLTEMYITQKIITCNAQINVYFMQMRRFLLKQWQMVGYAHAQWRCVWRNCLTGRYILVYLTRRCKMAGGGRRGGGVSDQCRVSIETCPHGTHVYKVFR